MTGDARAGWRARWGLRRRDFLLAVPLGVIAAVVVDIALHPDQPGLVSWASLGLSGGAIVLYLGLPFWDRR